MLMRIDPRIPTNNLDQAKANLDVARATLANALAQKQRSDELYKQQSITQTEHEQPRCSTTPTPRRRLSAPSVAMENAQIRLDETDVRAPITGTVIENWMSSAAR